ncbi:DUF3488 domain-containing protein [Catenulispora rubra]|uniref:DUF3488 domain-containing protein n=1 Tax=Catenulispora rubra TaxID=280293 RepID=UPI001E36A938|nr:DUF1616 domain-containing protein [Catenulispora rubra]
MGSEAETSADADAPPPPRRHRHARTVGAAHIAASRPVQATTAVAAVWLFAYAAHAVHLDLATLLVIVLGTAALNRYGSTVLDRIMAAVVLLAGTAIVGGLVISYWPWGLEPVAVGGFALSVLVLVSFAARRRFRLPKRFAAADAIAILSGAAATVIAAWPTLHSDFWKQFDYSALLADRLRQFAMFDVVRSGHSYAFAHFDRISAQALPGTRTYPSGMQMVYAIVDCFAHGDAKPGAPLDEFVRYYWYTLISFGLLVLATAWAARRMVGPMVADRLRLPSVFVTAGVGAFLSTGYFLSYVWQGFDSVVFACVFLVAGMAVILRPPRNVWEQVLLAGSAFLAVVFGHPLLLPHITLVLVAALVVYRRRFIKNRIGGKLAFAIGTLGVAVLVAAPLFAVSGLNIGTRFHTDGFIIALPWHVVLTVGVAAAIALANPATRRLPHAKAALGALAATGAVQIALEIDLVGHSSTRYYVEKSLNGLVLMCLVGLGGLANLWPQARPKAKPWPIRQAENAIAAVTAALAAGAVAFAPAYINWPRFQPGTDSTWAQLWTGRHTFVADYGHQLHAQQRLGVYTDGQPTIVASSPSGILNLNMSLLAGIANRDLHSVSSQINRTTDLYGLTGLPAKGEWSPQAKASLKILEHIITSNKVPIRIVVSDKVLAAKLQSFGAQHPQFKVKILYVP